MKQTTDLTRQQLEGIVSFIRARMFLADNGKDWVRDKEVSGADFVEDVFNILDENGLAPDAE
jgi:hypothetical protein